MQSYDKQDISKLWEICPCAKQFLYCRMVIIPGCQLPNAGGVPQSLWKSLQMYPAGTKSILRTYLRYRAKAQNK